VAPRRAPSRRCDDRPRGGEPPAHSR
jgi:hypothetical protein